MTELVDAYVRTRTRMIDVFVDAPGPDLDRTVPACPDWAVRDLAAHVVSLPAALGAGHLPDGDVGIWIQGLVDERRGQDVTALMQEWSELDDVIAPLLDGMGSVLFGDLAVHEHDLRGALGRPDHAALDVDVMMPRTLAGFAKPLRAEDLAAIAVEHDGRRWESHDREPGWTLLVDPWEAVRALNSRRTADELLHLPCTGDPVPYLAVLDAHLPLPIHSLGEEH